MASSRPICTLLPPEEHAFWHTPGCIPAVLQTVADLERDAEAQQQVLADLAQENAALRFAAESAQRDLVDTREQLRLAHEVVARLRAAQQQGQQQQQAPAGAASVQSSAVDIRQPPASPASPHESVPLRPRRALRDGTGFVASEPGSARARRFVPSDSPLPGGGPSSSASLHAATSHDDVAHEDEQAALTHLLHEQRSALGHGQNGHVLQAQTGQPRERGGGAHGGAGSHADQEAAVRAEAAGVALPAGTNTHVASAVAAAVAAATARAGATLTSLLAPRQGGSDAQASRQGGGAHDEQRPSVAVGATAPPQHARGAMLLPPAGVPHPHGGTRASAMQAGGVPPAAPHSNGTTAAAASPLSLPLPAIPIPTTGWQRAAVDAATRAVSAVTASLPGAAAPPPADAANAATTAAAAANGAAAQGAFYAQHDGLTAAERSAQRVASFPFARLSGSNGNAASNGGSVPASPAAAGKGGAGAQGWAFTTPLSAPEAADAIAGAVPAPAATVPIAPQAALPPRPPPPQQPQFLSLSQLYSAGSAPSTPSSVRATAVAGSGVAPQSPAPRAVPSDAAGPATPASERLAALREKRAAASAREEELRKALQAQLALVRRQAAR